MLFDQKKSDEISQKLLGMTFKMGGRGPEEIDCYGVLIQYFKSFGIDLPDYSYVDDWDEKEDIYLQHYSSLFRKLSDGETPGTGDVVLFKNIPESANHAGVYLGDDRFVHSYRKIGVKIDRLSNRAWAKKIYGVFRLK